MLYGQRKKMKIQINWACNMKRTILKIDAAKIIISNPTDLKFYLQ